MFVRSGVFTLAAGWQVLHSSVLIQFSTMSNEPTTGCHADAVKILTGMLPMLDAADPNDRAFKLATICVCVVSVGYLAHNPRIMTRIVELRVIIIEFFSFNDIDL
jgi:hypothetical protein